MARVELQDHRRALDVVAVEGVEDDAGERVEGRGGRERRLGGLADELDQRARLIGLALRGHLRHRHLVRVRVRVRVRVGVRLRLRLRVRVRGGALARRRRWPRR